jgi:hypothetical protein
MGRLTGHGLMHEGTPHNPTAAACTWVGLTLVGWDTAAVDCLICWPLNEENQ